MSVTIREPGGYRVHKADAVRLTKPHPTFAAAEREAKRLVGLYPDHSYIVAQEVARVMPGER
ncbi:hypothetical protein [Sphingopyxis macrogoltabida]|uniref:Uncharacterized protein n=1 Tax=Sphingopyxis macrogoltabida TaxID=33050 RepID=A0AAC9AX64_SPHMC|nr:hypothetical protein [Sphingopyxis macrogoltabida]ALJ15331.1 hypothetical protein LH19_20850 [Sphingopyxis macrogoltabida]AMU91582.1 hypothetical protein ATM17_21440 [Sphingopyxis macrogoltabida]